MSYGTVTNGTAGNEMAVMTRWYNVVVFAAMSLLVVACDEAEQAAKQTGARTSAEAFRVSVKA
jgi:hypothetical protein